MKQIKKMLAFVLAMSMVFGMTTLAMAAGDGTQENPYKVEVGKDPVKITIPDQSNANLSMDNTAGKIVTVSTTKDAEWSLQYGPNKYAYSDGTGEVSIKMKKGVWEKMHLINNSVEAVEFTIKAEKSDVVDVEGTIDSPYEIKVEKDLFAEGDVESYMAIMPEGLSIAAKSEGIYLTLKAPKDGLVAFQIMGFALEATDEWIADGGYYKTIQHPVQFSITNITASKASEICKNVGENDKNVCMVPASKDDEIQIWVNTYNEKDEWDTPAADNIGSVSVLFPELGDELNPESVESGKDYTNVCNFDSDTYYYQYTADQAGTLTMTISSSSADWFWMYANEFDEYGFPQFVCAEDANPGTASFTLKVGEKVLIGVKGAPNFDNNEDPDKETTIKTTFTFKANVEKDIADAKDGATIKVDTPKDQAVIGTSVLEAAKGKDVNLVMDMGGYTWTINGKDITSASALNLTITPDTPIVFNDADKKDIIADNKYQTFSIAYDGKLGLKATLTFEVDKAYANKNAALYLFVEGKGLDKDSVRNCVVSADGKVSYVFDHASDYVIVFTDVVEAPNTGAAPMAAWFVALAMLFGCAMIVAYKKMRA